MSAKTADQPCHREDEDESEIGDGHEGTKPRPEEPAERARPVKCIYKAA
jgi:hypothetical protein